MADLLPCTCHSDDLEPYCPRHTPLPGEDTPSAAQMCPGPNGNDCNCDAKGKDPLCPWWPLHPEDVKRSTMYRLNEQISKSIDVDGYKLPYIEAHTFADSDLISLVLDNRFGLDMNAEELERWLPFLADAMAVAAGRTSHGEHSNIRNPHGESLAGYPTPRILGEPLVEADA